jgi:putative FmdB family regulatory protein
MPTYEYLCQSCSHRFETWQKMTDEPLTTCPECGAHIRRVLYPAGIVFKGAGFYKTDHRNGAAPVSKDSNGETKKLRIRAQPAARANQPRAAQPQKAQVTLSLQLPQLPPIKCVLKDQNKRDSGRNVETW